MKPFDVIQREARGRAFVLNAQDRYTAWGASLIDRAPYPVSAISSPFGLRDIPGIGQHFHTGTDFRRLTNRAPSDYDLNPSSDWLCRVPSAGVCLYTTGMRVPEPPALLGFGNVFIAYAGWGVFWMVAHLRRVPTIGPGQYFDSKAVIEPGWSGTVFPQGVAGQHIHLEYFTFMDLDVPWTQAWPALFDSSLQETFYSLAVDEVPFFYARDDKAPNGPVVNMEPELFLNPNV